MIGRIIKAIAYMKYPKTMLALNHPKKGAKLGVTKWDMKHGYAPRLSALGVALIALPVGYVLGRMSIRRELEIGTSIPDRATRIAQPGPEAPEDYDPGL